MTDLALDPQARFPEAELSALAERYEIAARDLRANGNASPLWELFAGYARTIRQAIDAHDALRDRCLTAEVRVLSRVSPPALAGEETP